jgi:hypothetical protein
LEDAKMQQEDAKIRVQNQLEHEDAITRLMREVRLGDTGKQQTGCCTAHDF